MVAQIKILRNEARLTQAELAEMLGTTQQSIARWESGKSEPNITALKDLAMIFGCSVGDLLEMSEYQRPSSVRSHWMGNSFDGFWGHSGVHLAGAGTLDGSRFPQVNPKGSGGVYPPRKLGPGYPFGHSTIESFM